MEVLAADDATLTRMAESALGGLCGSAPTVLHSRVRRWSDALAEIGPGHDTRISGVRAELAERLPGVHRIVLSVNVKNPVAIRTYARAGFADSGRRYLGGAAGPQHVFELWL